MAGVERIGALAREGRWQDAEREADELRATFRDVHPIAWHSFDGLRQAARGRDPEELADFSALILELFARPPGV